MVRVRIGSQARSMECADDCEGNALYCVRYVQGTAVGCQVDVVVSVWRGWQAGSMELGRRDDLKGMPCNESGMPR